MILETYRECLRDVLDVPGLQELLRAIDTRAIGIVEVETQTASPFASSLLFDYVATYMYEGDTPAAERRAVPSPWTASCFASCSGRRSCATSSTRARWSRWRTTCSTAPSSCGRATPTRCTRCCGASAT